MSWNFLSIVEYGAQTKGLYPTPTGTAVGIEQLPADTHAVTYDLYAIGTHRSVDGTWKRVGLVRGAAATLIVSDLRVAVVYKVVPHNQSMFTLVAAGQAIANLNKHKGESLVGHALLNQIKSVAAQDFAAGLNKKLPTLRFLFSDKTSGTAVEVLVEIIFSGKPKATQIGDDLVRRMVARRITSPAFASMSTSFETWKELARRPFAPARGEFEAKSFPYKHVVAADNEWEFDSPQTGESARTSDGPVATRKAFAAKAAQELQAGNALLQAGKDRDALKHYMESAASSHNASDPQGELAAVIKLAEVFNRLGGYDEAINCSARAIELSVGQADRRSEGLAFAARGLALRGKECHAEARGAFEAAFHIFQVEWPQLASWVHSLS